jgi:Domain of Unknown Function (DUF349)
VSENSAVNENRPEAEQPGPPAPPPGRTAPLPAPRPVAGRPASDPGQWGRVAEDGTVYVRTPDGERSVGSYPGATPQEALAYFGRKYDDLVAQADLLEQRLTSTDVSAKDAARSIRTLRAALAEAHAVGDLAGLAARVDALEQLTAQRRQAAEATRAAAREQARAGRTALVEEAETIAGQESERIQWKPAGDRLRELLDAWKEQQRNGPRLDKSAEDDLWRRFSHARTTFDRKRRTHFAHVEQRHAEVRALKERLVAEAEELSTSTDWGATSAAYRQLMDRWKAAGRASRKDDDALWARFRAAQDAFFAARGAVQSAQDQELSANLAVKEKLLAEAEALLPVRDVEAARSALRGIGERWEAAGKVPRADVGRIERRMRAVEQAVADAEQDRWSRSNPEAKARADGALAQLEQSISALEADLAHAQGRGDARAVADARAALSARRQWLEQVRRAAEEFS